MNANRAVPAFAKPLADARRRGLTLRDPTVSVSLHTRKRPGLGYGIVVPDDADPGELDWSWARGLEVIVFRRGDDSQRVMRALAAIEAARPRRLLVVDFQDSRIVSLIAPGELTRAAA